LARLWATSYPIKPGMLQAENHWAS